MSAIILHKHGTAAWLAANNPHMRQSEKIVEIDTGREKIGPLGGGYWNDQPYAGMPVRRNPVTGYFHTAAYGARGDSLHITDGAMATGTAVLTSASGLFRAGMVGKAVSVKGAAATVVIAGISPARRASLVTTIVSVDSPTQVTLAAPAQTNVSAADVQVYVTDDTAAFAAAEAAANAAGGGTVWLDGIAGDTFTVRRPSSPAATIVNWRSRITVKGAGRSVTHVLNDASVAPSATGCAVFRVGTESAGADHVAFEDFTLHVNQSRINGTHTADTSAGPNGGGSIWGITARSTGADSAATALISSNHVTVRRVDIYDSRIAVSAVKPSFISNSLAEANFHRDWHLEDVGVYYTNNRAVEFAYTSKVTIDGLTVRGAGYLHLLYFTHGVRITKLDMLLGDDGSLIGGLAPATSAYDISVSDGRIEADQGASLTSTDGLIAFRTENVTFPVTTRLIRSARMSYVDTRTTARRAFHVLTQTSVPAHTVQDFQSEGDYFDANMDWTVGAQGAVTSLIDWRFTDVTVMGDLVTSAPNVITVARQSFLRGKLRSASLSAVAAAGFTFDQCETPNAALAIGATAVGTKVRKHTGTVVNAAPGTEFDQPIRLFKAADATPIASSTALVDDADLQATLDPGTYLVHGQLHYTADTAGDFKFGFAGPSGTTFRWGTSGGTAGLTSAIGSGQWDSLTLADSRTVGGVGASVYYAARFEGLLTITTAGVFKLQWAQGTSSAVNTTLRAGSTMTLDRLA